MVTPFILFIEVTRDNGVLLGTLVQKALALDSSSTKLRDPIRFNEIKNGK